jgi:hypothetical protein
MAQFGALEIHWFEPLEGACDRDRFDRALRPFAGVQPGFTHRRFPGLVAVRLYRLAHPRDVRRVANNCGYAFVEGGYAEAPMGQLGGLARRSADTQGIYP